MKSSNAKGVKCNVNCVYLTPFGYNLSKLCFIFCLFLKSGEEGGRGGPVMRPTISSMNKMTPRALKRKSSLSQAASTGEMQGCYSSKDSDFSDSPNSCMGTGSLYLI